MSVEIRGIDDVRRVLRDIMPKEAKVLSRQTVKDVAEAIVDEATPLMPVDEGDLRAGTNAAPAKDRDGIARAAVRVRKAFYWRFLEYGDGPDGIEHAFFMRARERVMQNIDSIATTAFVRRLAARLAKIAGR